MANFVVPEITFTKSERKKTKLRLAITGVSGSGKTFTALTIGCALAKALGGRVALADTENERSASYANIFDFDSVPLKAPFIPELFEAVIKSAEKTHCVLIIDNITAEWAGSGGCLEINENTAHNELKGNTWAAWAKTTPRHNSFIETMQSSSLHVISTIRSKSEYVQEGKKVFKLGMKLEQREGIEFEFHSVLNMQHESNIAISSKDVTGLFKEPFLPTANTALQLFNWVNEGVDPYERSKSLVDMYIQDMRKTKNMDELKGVFRKAHAESQTFKDLLDEATKVKDEIKAKFEAPQKTAYQAIHDAILNAKLEVDIIHCENRAKSLENKAHCEQLLTMAHHRRVELEGNTQHFDAPPTDSKQGDSGIPDIIKDEMDLMIEIESLTTIDEVDHMIKRLESHPVVDERTRLLVEANKKRKAITFQLEQQA